MSSCIPPRAAILRRGFAGRKREQTPNPMQLGCERRYPFALRQRGLTEPAGSSEPRGGCRAVVVLVFAVVSSHRQQKGLVQGFLGWQQC